MSNRDLLNDLADALETNLRDEARKYYEGVIFRPSHPQQTPYDKYVATYAKDTADLIQRARDAANAEDDA